MEGWRSGRLGARRIPSEYPSWWMQDMQCGLVRTLRSMPLRHQHPFPRSALPRGQFSKKADPRFDV